MELELGSRKESHWVPPMVTNSVRSMVLKMELRLVQPKELHLALQMEKNCNNNKKDQIARPRVRTIYRHTKTSDKHTLADPMELVLGSRKESHWVPPMVTNSVRSTVLKMELRLVQPKEVHLALQMEKNCNNREKRSDCTTKSKNDLETYQDQ
jgi:ornithine carbamoyltransferase